MFKFYTKQLIFFTHKNFKLLNQRLVAKSSTLSNAKILRSYYKSSQVYRVKSLHLRLLSPSDSIVGDFRIFFI